MSGYLDRTILTWTVIFTIINMLLMLANAVEPTAINFAIPYVPFFAWFIYRGFINASSS